MLYNGALTPCKMPLPKQSPNDLVFCFRPRDILGNKVLVSLQATEDPMTPTPDDIIARRDEAKQTIESTRSKWKQRYDLRRKPALKYKKDDLIVAKA